MLNLNIIIGSTRPGRAADHVAPWIAGLAKEHPAFTVEVLDLRDWPLPFFAETYQTIGDPQHPAYSDPIVRRWNQRIAEGDAYLFITPEYNHSVPGVLKNAIDSVFASFAFRHKPAAFVGYSGGIAAGVRAIEHLAHIAIEAEMVPLRSTVLIPLVGAAFDHNGEPQNPAAATAAGIMLDDLAWWAAVLQQARRDNPLPPAALRKMATAGKQATRTTGGPGSPRTKARIMPAYIAFLIDIHDQAAFSGYARAAAPTYATYGGRIALRGPIADILEGTLEVKQDTRLVVLQFPSLDQARAWWESPEYRPLAELRQPPVSASRVFLVDGIDLGNQR